jgi:outer membrane protein assembly factor BamB
VTGARASDWPQFLGPTRNGVYSGGDLADSWPTDGPSVVWKKSVGPGFSSPVVADGKLVLFHLLNDKEAVECLDARTGAPVWDYSYPTAFNDRMGSGSGPRATPCIAGGRVFTYGAEGMLTCLDFKTGKKTWNVDAKAKFSAPEGYFGIACSPLAEGTAVLLNIGGTDNAGIVAFDQATGKVLWKTSHDAASYSSPIAATVDGHRYAFFFTREGLAAVDPGDGKIQFEFPWRPPMEASVSSATPLVEGNLIFLSASYGTGAILLRVKDKSVEKVWSADDVLSNHYATSVIHNDLLFGIDGRTDDGRSAGLRCVELMTGKVRWNVENFGPATITLAGDQLLILTLKGELIRAPASGDRFKPAARAQVLSFGARAYPAIANGLLYARAKDRLVCLDLTNSKESPSAAK